MKDLPKLCASILATGRSIKTAVRQNLRAKQLDLCYTSFALITSVVLCGPSGALADLRLPASSFLPTFYA